MPDLGLVLELKQYKSKIKIEYSITSKLENLPGFEFSNARILSVSPLIFLVFWNDKPIVGLYLYSD